MMIPMTIGMPRSASRMTWQIVSKLSPPEAPPDYYPELVEQWTAGEKHTWPLRGHSYLPGPPVIYTFRHPVEAFLSLRSRYRTDVGKEVPEFTGYKTIAGEEIPDIDPSRTVLYTQDQADKDAMLGIGIHWTVWRRLRQDAEAGRPVLFLKYENYFESRENRIEEIAKFMDVPLSSSLAKDIFDYTSIDVNLERSQNPSFYENENVTFSRGFLGKSGMQKEHINTSTMGIPGAHLTTDSQFVVGVLNQISPAHSALKEMTEEMGYEVLF